MIKKYILLLIYLLLTSKNVFATFPNSFADIVKKEKDKVVHVFNTLAQENNTPFDDLFGPPNSRQRARVASGSGFFVSKDGYILTNAHVIQKADSLEVILSDERSYPAKIIGKDPKTDLALIKIDTKNAPSVIFGNSDKVEIGDWLVAIGNPLGLDFTVTAGILSARNRDIFRGTAYGTFLQTDAAINEGNSGGPLFNIHGEVIGINTAVAAYGQGVGFAIPSNLAVKIMNQLRKYGEVRRGWLGVAIQNVKGPENKNLSKNEKGVAITAVQIDSPADKSGLKKDDVIIKYNDEKVTKTSELQQKVAETEVDSKVKIEFYRKNKLLTKSVKITSFPENPDAVQFISDFNKYGMKLSVLTEDIKKRRNIKKTYNGLIIENLEKEAVAIDNDFKIGDVILEINGLKMNSLADFDEAITKTNKKTALLLVLRNDQEIYRSLPLE